MAQPTPDPRELVMTEAEPPPGPAHESPAGPDPQLLRDLQALADRAGGYDKLRAALDALRRQRR